MDLIIGAGVTGISNANFTKEQLCHAEATDSPSGYCTESWIIQKIISYILAK